MNINLTDLLQEVATQQPSEAWRWNLSHVCPTATESQVRSAISYMTIYRDAVKSGDPHDIWFAAGRLDIIAQQLEALTVVGA